jgi:hypothetical protein
MIAVLLGKLAKIRPAMPQRTGKFHLGQQDLKNIHDYPGQFPQVLADLRR